MAESMLTPSERREMLERALKFRIVRFRREIGEWLDRDAIKGAPNGYEICCAYHFELTRDGQFFAFSMN